MGFLLSRLFLRLFLTGNYSDLTIVCGAKRYPVHRALLATRSPFFEGACRNGFREAQSGLVDLSEDDAEAVEHMVHCRHMNNMMCIGRAHRCTDFYHNDYLNKPLSRHSSRRSSRSGSSPSLPPSMRRSPPRQLNLALSADPLLAQATAANNAPITPPADGPAFQNFDLSSKLSDTPIAHQFEDDDVESVGSEPEPAIEKSHLVVHAKVYAIAEKYVYSFCWLLRLPTSLPGITPLYPRLLPFTDTSCSPRMHALCRTADELRLTPRFASLALAEGQSHCTSRQTAKRTPNQVSK